MSTDYATVGLPAARGLVRAAAAWLLGDGSDLSAAYQTAAEFDAEDSDAVPALGAKARARPGM
eukprot:6318513-Alexandrium_andersonii.AAC.1